MVNNNESPIPESNSEVYAISKECAIGACPGVYERRLDPGFATYPDKIVRLEPDVVYVVGILLTQKEIKEKGLAKVVGEGESIVELPRRLLPRNLD
jgi:hypothetical protein